MEGCVGQNENIALSPRTSVLTYGTTTRMEGCVVQNGALTFSAADIRLQMLQQLQEWGAVGPQNGALALAPRTFVLQVCNSYTDS